MNAQEIDAYFAKLAEENKKLKPVRATADLATYKAQQQKLRDAEEAAFKKKQKFTMQTQAEGVKKLYETTAREKHNSVMADAFKKAENTDD